MSIHKKFLGFTLFLAVLSFPLSSKNAATTETGFAQQLFVIERSKNANKVHYEAHLTSEGVLDVRKPVHAYWINWEKDSTGKDCEELNLIEKRMAFGFSVSHKRTPQSCVMKLVCCPKRPIKVSLNNGTACAGTDINGKPAYLHKISVVTCEKKKILPQVLSVTVYGTDVATGKEVDETIKPR
jgi:hypothetical protein